MSESKTIIAFGELLWDVFPTGEALGGAPANFAYRINSLGHDGRLVTRLGKDDRGRHAADLVRENRLPPNYVHSVLHCSRGHEACWKLINMTHLFYEHARGN